MSDDVEAMFDRIAPKYDRTNTVLSLGVHKRWKRKAVRAAAQPGSKVLDLATGTGDLAFQLHKAVQPGGSVIGGDISQGMLRVARERAAAAGVKIRFERADAMELQYDDDAFDACTIAFGIRNVDDPVAGLREMVRVVKPGGRIVVLEFGQPDGLLAGPYRFYSRFVMPRVGGAMTGDRQAYEYLPKTAGLFPCGDAFLERMRIAGGMTDLKAKRLTGGIAWLYTGVVA